MRCRVHISTKKRNLPENSHDATITTIAAKKQAVTFESQKIQKNQVLPKQLPNTTTQSPPVTEEAHKGNQKAVVLPSADSSAKETISSAIADANDAGTPLPRLPEGDKSDSKTIASSSSAGINSNQPPTTLSNIAADNKANTATSHSARKSARRTANKKNKTSRKNSKSKKKTEEDPWVQCDRCHKWRHLPGSVDLDSLPEHWFCELNTYDAKRNNCEAPEQTPKEVAKEKKKRAKKLAAKKMQLEQHQQAEEDIGASDLAESKNETKKKKARSNSPKNSSDQETEFESPENLPEEKTTTIDFEARGKNITHDAAITANTSRDESFKSPFKPKGKRGRPRRDGKEKTTVKGGGKDESPKQQEWVQCEKCEKWRRLPLRISAKDLPDIWFCSMNTWDINLAICTAVEDRHESNTSSRDSSNKTNNAVATRNANAQQYSEQSQIPTTFGSSSKLSYRNLIFGSGRRRQKNISERICAQESLFSSHKEEDADVSLPPTVMYANSNVFFNQSLNKATSFEEGQEMEMSVTPQRTSVFDIVSCSQVWQELSNSAISLDLQNKGAYESIG